MFTVLTIISGAVILTLNCVMCLDNGLARTPPMGWNTWHAFRCRVDCQKYPNNCLNEDAIKRTADKLVSDGWRDLGYKYVILDDCWLAKQRNPKTNSLMADPSRFPSGIEYIAKYLHSKNLLLGVTLSFGAKTCSGYPGSINHLELDAKTVADWGVDYVKMLACHPAENTAPDDSEKLNRLLNATGRPVMLLCTYPVVRNWLSKFNLTDWKKLQNNCNLWRVTFNVQNNWRSIIDVINGYKLRNDILPKVAGPGHYTDPDMLVLGNNALLNDQKRVHMGMWCMFAAPLVISADMDKMDQFSASLLRNKHLLAIDQDEGGHQAEFVKSRNDVQLWIRKLDNCPTGWAIACIYTKVDGGPIEFSTNLDEFKSQMYSISGDKFELLDVFTGDRFKDVRLTENFTISINPSGIMMFRIIPFHLITSS
ncbi:unnamed protein product [Schistosoma margrebowiei]|uniref:Alpha-galactosidase n=1 Tax=Schistosoma margrebowiei TaxID=48269 RepID=A0A183MB49_9TREM|nr:unnamed protein product [Schistosoma margrebowiei]